MKHSKKPHHSEIEFEDKHLELNLDKDLNDYISQKKSSDPWAYHDRTHHERIATFR